MQITTSQKNSTQQGQSWNAPLDRNTARTQRIFVKMSLIFATAWTGQFKTDAELDAAQSEWADATRNQSDETLKRVLDYLRDESGLSFPPRLPEFMSLCRQFRVQQQMKALPKSIMTKAEAIEALARIKAGIK